MDEVCDLMQSLFSFTGISDDSYKVQCSKAYNISTHSLAAFAGSWCLLEDRGAAREAKDDLNVYRSLWAAWGA